MVRIIGFYYIQMYRCSLYQPGNTLWLIWLSVHSSLSLRWREREELLTIWHKEKYLRSRIVTHTAGIITMTVVPKLKWRPWYWHKHTTQSYTRHDADELCILLVPSEISMYVEDSLTLTRVPYNAVYFFITAVQLYAFLQARINVEGSHSERWYEWPWKNIPH